MEEYDHVTTDINTRAWETYDTSLGECRKSPPGESRYYKVGVRLCLLVLTTEIYLKEYLKKFITNN